MAAKAGCQPTWELERPSLVIAVVEAVVTADADEAKVVFVAAGEQEQ